MAVVIRPRAAAERKKSKEGNKMDERVCVIGGGLAGVEAAWALANRGIAVDLFEMKGVRFSPAHHSEKLAELVCSNSLKAKRLETAAGLLKSEMRLFGSLCMQAADVCEVPAGGALAVDRDAFSAYITEKINAHPLIALHRQEVTAIPEGPVIVAAGPLASDALSGEIQRLCGAGLSFFDAAAPIVTKESLDFDCCFTQSRYERGGEDDYINCPMNKAEYEAFYDAIMSAERAELHTFDERKDVFCWRCRPPVPNEPHYFAGKRPAVRLVLLLRRPSKCLAEVFLVNPARHAGDGVHRPVVASYKQTRYVADVDDSRLCGLDAYRPRKRHAAMLVGDDPLEPFGQLRL